MIYVECYLDKVITNMATKMKVSHVMGKGRIIKRIRQKRIKEGVVIIDEDPGTSEEGLKHFGNCEIEYEDEDLIIARKEKIKIVVLRPDLEGFLRKLGLKLNFDTKSRNEGYLRKNLEREEKLEKVLRVLKRE